MSLYTLFNCVMYLSSFLKNVILKFFLFFLFTAMFILYSNMTSFIIGYIYNTMIKLPIYFNLHMCIEKQIINIIPKWINVCIQNCGVYIKHKDSCIVMQIFPSRIKIIHVNHSLYNVSTWAKLFSFHFIPHYHPRIKFYEIVLPMLKLDTNYGFHELFLK
jgi:hypothetical protein